MTLLDYIKKLIIDYFILFALIVIILSILRQILSPEAYYPSKDIFIYMICAFVGTLPSLIFYSSKDISEKEMRIRIIIHFVLLETVLLTLINITGWIHGVQSTIEIGIQIALIYVLFRIVSWVNDFKIANKINAKLKPMKDTNESE